MKTIEISLEAIPITRGPKNHFFGYYDKLQWDVTGRWLLAYEVDFHGRRPLPDDLAVIGLVDSREDYAFKPISETFAWCWQQGAMLQWLPGSESVVIHNARIGDRFVAVMLDVFTGARRVLPRPVYAVSNDAHWGVSINFSRLGVERPGYGYEGLRDHWEGVSHPSDDGVYIMDLSTGEHKLIVSIDEMYERARAAELCEEGGTHRFNHLLFNHDDSRFIFLHRWRGEKGNGNRLCTANPDGSGIFVSRLTGPSHFIWYDKDTILIWGKCDDVPGYYLVSDRTDEIKPVAPGVLTKDGHCTVTRDRRWLLTDEYQDAEDKRPIILYDMVDQSRIDIARLYSAPPPEGLGDCRCDLHPRWNRDDRLICFDSTHEGTRQMYIMDVTPVTGG